MNAIVGLPKMNELPSIAFVSVIVIFPAVSGVNANRLAFVLSTFTSLLLEEKYFVSGFGNLMVSVSFALSSGLSGPNPNNWNPPPGGSRFPNPLDCWNSAEVDSLALPSSYHVLTVWLQKHWRRLLYYPMLGVLRRIA